MTPCKYKEDIGCSCCKHVNYRECKQFRQAYLRDLTKEIAPIKLVEISSFNRGVLFSRNEQLIKTHAAFLAYQSGSKIQKLSLNQALSIVLDGDMGFESLRGIVFIECSVKPFGDLDKVNQVLWSFVDKCVLLGISVFVYSKLVVIKRSESWIELK